METTRRIADVPRLDLARLLDDVGDQFRPEDASHFMPLPPAAKHVPGMKKKPRRGRFGLETVVCISTGFGTKCRRRGETMSWLPPEQEGKTGGPGHFGAARPPLWATSPRMYLSALPAHPVELRARRGRCRFGPIPAGVNNGLVVRSPAGVRSRGRALGLAVSGEELP